MWLKSISMELVIFGASGQTGRLLVEQALDLGHQVTAYVRRAGAISLQHPKLRVITGQLNDTSKLLEAITGADVCFSTLGGGSLSKRSQEFTQGIDGIVTVMEEEGVNRFIYLSSLGAGESRYFMGPFVRFIITGLLLRIPLADHSANEERLAKSNLLWTIVRPGSLTTGVKTGKSKYGDDFIKLTGNPKVSRADVASFMLDLAGSRNYIKKGVWLFD
jgi:putative NADH-flavin reductase